MNKFILFILLLIFTWAPVASSLESAQELRAYFLYNKHCSACHPDAAKLKPGVNIVELIRKPIASMPAFDRTKISDEEAQLIADYIKRQIYYSIE